MRASFFGESDLSGTDGDGASARLDVPTAPQSVCRTEQRVQHVCASFFFTRMLGYVHE